MASLDLDAPVTTGNAKLDRARKRFKLAQDADSQQRRREKEDLQFQVPELQWDENAKRQRMGDVSTSVPIPPRPMLSISKLDQPIQLIYNQARAARLGVNIHPVSEDANKEGAEIRQGLYRRIERDSNANQARLWALDRAVKAGRGYYRVSTKYDEDAPEETFDQEIVIERILNQENVYYDPGAKEADFSDAEYCFVVAWKSLDDFKLEFPDSGLAQEEASDQMFWESAESSAPGWIKLDGEDRAVLVAEYWYKDHHQEEIKVGKQSRKRDIVSVHCCKITGTEILEESEWNGRYLPIIPVVGKELQPFDDQRRWTGMVGPSRDGQRLYNFAASSLVERMALEPKAPFIGYVGQFEGLESMWQQANVRNFPYLEINATTDQSGSVLPTPQRAQIDQSGMSLAMLALQEADRFIQTTTSVYDPSLGRESSRDKSGKAILALQQQSDAGTSHFLSSLADISMPYEARVVLDLMPKIYDRPGRVTTILKGDDNKAEHVMLNAPFVPGQDGMPQALQPGMMPQQAPKEYNLAQGRYSISVDVGKSFQTRLQQGADEIGQILSGSPDLMPIIGDLYFRYRDFPGATDIADRLAKVREQTHPGLDEGDKQNDPAQAQAKLAGMQQQMQEMQQMMQEMQQALQTEKVKADAELQRTQMDNASREKIAQMNNATKLQVEAAKDAKDRDEGAQKRTYELGQKREEMAHDTERDREEMVHEAALAAAGASQKEQIEREEPKK